MNKISINLVIVAIYSITPLFLEYIDGVYRSNNIVLFEQRWIYDFPLLMFFIHLLTLIGITIYNFGMGNNKVTKEYFGTIFMIALVFITIFIAEVLYFFGKGF